jgi:type 1 glutamine amidotransferase
MISSCTQHSKDSLKILIVAGGHRYDTLSFQQTFNGMEGVEPHFIGQPDANQLIASGGADDFNALVFYDSWKLISEEEKQGYYDLLEKGTGMVFLHHALVSYQNWPEFTQIIGGKYKQARFEGDTFDLSDYKHDIHLTLVTNPNHPITKNVADFSIFDEGYINLQVIPSVNLLLTTNHEYSDSRMGWAHQVNNSRVVYLLPGHAKEGLHNPDYNKVIENSILWVTEKD